MNQAMFNNIITLDSLKEHLNINKCYFEDDAYLSTLLDAACLAVAEHARIKIDDGNEYFTHPIIIQAIKILAATWYKNRESNIVGLSVTELPLTFGYLIKLIRSYKKTY
jgi:hypothetical protein